MQGLRMVRVVIGLVLFASLVYAATAVLQFLATVAGFDKRGRLTAHAGKKEDQMPALLRHVSYGLLLALMFGIATGWLGGL